MDHANRFETHATYSLHRLEWLAALAAVSVLGLLHLGQVRWWVFAAFFAGIDLIGYVPGAIAYRRRPGHAVPRGYYVAYNTMHSLLTGGALVGLWCLAVRPEWALLAVPIHLFGDRGIFGNTLKPFGIAFEPEPLPAFTAFERAYAHPVGEVARDALRT